MNRRPIARSAQTGRFVSLTYARASGHHRCFNHQVVQPQKGEVT
jgi:hypothetical protein